MKSMNYSLIRTICALVIGLVLVLVPNIIAQWGDITASIGRMTSGEMPVISSETGALNLQIQRFGKTCFSALFYRKRQIVQVFFAAKHISTISMVP